MFVEYADSIELDEQNAYLVLPHALLGCTANHLNAGKSLGRGSTRGAHNWPTAVQSFILAYATNEKIKAAVTEFKNCMQEKADTEEDFFDHFRQNLVP